MILFGMVVGAVLATQAAVPFELKFLDLLLAEVAQQPPADTASLIGASDVCETMVASEGKATPPQGWSSLIQDEWSLIRNDGVVLIYNEEDDETYPGCMIFSKPEASQKTIEDALAAHRDISRRSSVELGSLNLPATLLAGKTYDYQAMNFDNGAISTVKNKGAVVIGISFKEVN